jgi:hypothetical protein
MIVFGNIRRDAWGRREVSRILICIAIAIADDHDDDGDGDDDDDDDTQNHQFDGVCVLSHCMQLWCMYTHEI